MATLAAQPRVTMTIRLSAERYQWLSEQARQQGTTMTAIIDALITRAQRSNASRSRAT